MKFSAFLVVLVTFFFILSKLLNYSPVVISTLPKINFIVLGVTGLSYLFYLYCRAISWDFIIKSLGEKTSFSQGLSNFFLGEVTRYIPGNVWSFISRTYLSERSGIKKIVTATSLAIEICLMIVIASLFSIPALLKGAVIYQLNTSRILVLIFLAVLIGIISLRKNIFGLRDRIEKIPKLKLLSKDFILGVLFQIIAWFFYGLGTYFLVTNLTQNTNFLFIFSAVILSWLIGYLSFITPMGLGVREGALILLLGPLVGVGQATVIALISRLILIIVEVLNGSYFLYRQKKGKLVLQSLKNWPTLILIILIIFYAITFSALSILRHNAFSSNFDLANMDQTIWNTIHGRIFVMTADEGNVSRLETHADFILILISPLYLLWDNVRTLLVAQSIFLALGVIPVYFLAKKILGNIVENSAIPSLILSLVYLLNPGMQWTNIYDFHGVALAIPLILATFYFAYTKNWKWYWVFLILSLTTKEEVSLFLAIMGFFIAVFFKSWKTGLLSFLLGIAWFPLMVFLVIPHFSQNGQHWAFNDWFSAPKSELDEHNFIGLFNLVKSSFIAPSSRDYYSLLISPFAFLPILGLPWILMALPEVLINVTSTHTGMQSITLHYQSGITPALIIASIFSVRYILWGIKKFTNLPKRMFLKLSIIICLVILAFSIDANYRSGPLPGTPSCWCYMFQVNNDDRRFEALLQDLPDNAIISASAEVRPHLTHRQNVSNLPQVPKNTEYIALSDQKRSFSVYEVGPLESDIVKKLSAKSSQFALEDHIGHFYLFRRKS